MQQWHELETLKGYSLMAADGEIGTITDVWFDDDRWTVRYLVVRTGGWLLGRKVLLAPSVVRGVNVAREQIAVELTREQVENSPPMDSEQPVSRHHESQLHKHYGWTPYWVGGNFGALGTMGADVAPPPEPQAPVMDPPEPHLRSSDEVRGYAMHARDGNIGEVVDFVIHEEDWTIRYLVADTRKWLPGRTVLLAPSWVQAIRWSDREIAIDMERETLRTAPEYQGPQAIDKLYEVHLYQHYGVALRHAHEEPA
ncbi:MAG: PRC-barrel domain-containing protein [Burkholderiaceae bacterium]|nr:PRC-barrel domain-containing protein [Rhodoferax sp.]MCB2041870.1 PRC-barrel domain-containing protein [Rhodoferax sp.]MCW5630864.1 PRC-barrel domain-containing protein [Rhodoferax sp.]MCW5642985.1 PRC-barrel domain-containing protein [Rhodoferax sp.]